MYCMKLKLFTLAGLILLLFACKTIAPVNTDYDTSFNYLKLKNYAWMKLKDPKQVISLDERRSINAIDAVLKEKGFNKVTSREKADFVLSSHIIKDKKTDVDSFYRTWGYYPFYDNWHHNFNQTVKREYQVNTFVLDVIDPQNKQMIWRGSLSAKSGIYKRSTPEVRVKKARQRAQNLLSSFPPKTQN